MAPVALSQTKHLLDQALSDHLRGRGRGGGDRAGGEPQHPGRQGGGARVHGEARPGVHRRVGASPSSRPAQAACALHPAGRARAPAPPRPRSTARARCGSPAGRAWPVRRGRLASTAAASPTGGVRRSSRGRAVFELERDQHVGRLEHGSAPSEMQRVGARGRRVAPRSGIRQHRAAVLERALGGDARAALQRGLHDDHDLGQTRDDPVAHRERLRGAAARRSRARSPAGPRRARGRTARGAAAGTRRRARCRRHRPPRRRRRARPRARRRRSRSRARSPR